MGKSTKSYTHETPHLCISSDIFFLCIHYFHFHVIYLISPPYLTPSNCTSLIRISFLFFSLSPFPSPVLVSSLICFQRFPVLMKNHQPGMLTLFSLSTDSTQPVANSSNFYICLSATRYFPFYF